MVPKWHLAGQLAGMDFFNTRARGANMFPPQTDLGAFGLLKNEGKSALEIMGLAGMFIPPPPPRFLFGS